MIATQPSFPPSQRTLLEGALEITERRLREVLVSRREVLVGELYDEFDHDVGAVGREPGGALVLPGTFPLHDLPDLGVDLPEDPMRPSPGWPSTGWGGSPKAARRSPSTAGRWSSWRSTATPSNAYACAPTSSRRTAEGRPAGILLLLRAAPGGTSDARRRACSDG
jgi:hypothetical protein